MQTVSTFSIVANDPARQEWGVAVQSKFLAAAAVVSWARAGAGSVATQSYANLTYGPKGIRMMEQGMPAQEVIAALIDVGVGVLNPQFRANGLEGLKEIAKGRVALNLDLDRQLFPFATPSQIEDHIGEALEALYMPEGGLMLFAECEPDVSLENIDAVRSAFERICNPPKP